MKVSRETREAHRSAILDAASRLFRERGPDGVGVAEITRAAGLTHGAFYGHFPSKEALLAEAVSGALEGAATRLRAAVSDRSLGRYAAGYLGGEHRADRGGGCPVAALGGDMARQSSPEVRAAFAEGLRRFIDAGAEGGGDRRGAIEALAKLVGALVMARAVEGADPALADEIAAAVAAASGEGG